MLGREVNHFILELHRAARRVPAEQFKPWVFERLHRLIQFDSGIWITGTHELGPDVHSIYLDNQPMEMMENYERFKDQDFLVREHLKQPGITYDSNKLMPREKFLQLPAYEGYCRIYGMEHVLSTAQRDPETAVITFISFYRADPDKPFTERERLLKEMLTPHLVEAFTTNLFWHLHQPREDTGAKASGICDRRGVLSQTEADFASLVHEEWPASKGRVLPNEVVEAIRPTQVDGAARDPVGEVVLGPRRRRMTWWRSFSGGPPCLGTEKEEIKSNDPEKHTRLPPLGCVGRMRGGGAVVAQ